MQIGDAPGEVAFEVLKAAAWRTSLCALLMGWQV